MARIKSCANENLSLGSHHILISLVLLYLDIRLPELGPIGSNGLANARDFQAPVAAFETEEGGYEIVKTYADDGKSGLRLDGREGLKRLFADVASYAVL